MISASFLLQRYLDAVGGHVELQPLRRRAQINAHAFLVLERHQSPATRHRGASASGDIGAGEVLDALKVVDVSRAVDMGDADVCDAEAVHRKAMIGALEVQGAVAPGVADARGDTGARERDVRAAVLRHGRSDHADGEDRNYESTAYTVHSLLLLKLQ